MLGPVLGIGDFLHIVAHHILELFGLHGLGELGQLLAVHVEFFAFEERVIHLFLLLCALGIHTNPVEVF